jgi:hypothetical protein
LQVNFLEFGVNGAGEDLVDDIETNPLGPGQMTNIDRTFQASICLGIDSSSVVTVQASPPNGDGCQDSSEYNFMVSPLVRSTPSPVSLAPVPLAAIPATALPALPVRQPVALDSTSTPVTVLPALPVRPPVATVRTSTPATVLPPVPVRPPAAADSTSIPTLSPLSTTSRSPSREPLGGKGGATKAPSKKADKDGLVGKGGTRSPSSSPQVSKAKSESPAKEKEPKTRRRGRI